MKIKHYFVVLSLLFSQIIFAAYQSSIPVKIGILTNDPPASYTTSTGLINGIGPDFIDKISGDLPVKIDYIKFDNRKTAIQAIKNNDIQLLVGSFEADKDLAKYNITNTKPYFIDQINIVSKKYELSIMEILNLVFNKLFLLTLFICFVVGIFFTILLYFVEKDSHPHFKDCSRFEKLSYSFFTIFSCFFRDLLYDPVTTFGRTLFGIWILISVFSVTVLSAIITSSVLYLMDKGTETLYNTSDLKTTQIGVIFGQKRLEDMIKKAGGKPVIYDTMSLAFDALIDNKINYFAAGKTNLSKFLDRNYEIKEQISVSKVSLGYETWVILSNQYYGQIIMDETLVNILDKSLYKYRNDFTMFNICSRYIDHPELCVF